MPVDKITHIVSSVHPLGYEIDMEWGLPSTLPLTFDIVVFKKAGSDVTQTEIDNYFSSGDPLVPPEDVTVAHLRGDYELSEPTQLNDFGVKDSTKYYYKLVIYDLSSKEYSNTIDFNKTPEATVVTENIDAKQKVIDGVKRLLGVYGLKERSKDGYHLLHSYGFDEVKTLQITVVRIAGQIRQQYIGHFIDNIKSSDNSVKTSELDTDVIQLIIESPSHKQRDKILGIFREGKEPLGRYLLSEDGGNMDVVDIIIEGDMINNYIVDKPQVGCSVTIQCGISIVQKYTEDLAKWDSHETTVLN